MKTKFAQNVQNNEIYQNEKLEMDVDFTVVLDGSGVCESTEIKQVICWIPYVQKFQVMNYDSKVYEIAEQLIEAWIEQNKYNETSEFRKRLSEENDV